MKDRVLTLLFALAAFLLAMFLLTPPLSSGEKISLPTSEDRGSDGLKGLYQWLQNNKIRVSSLRKRFTDLSKDHELAETGNVLIVSSPFNRQVLTSEWQALQRWVADGNTVLVLGAGYYIPDWANRDDCFCQIDALLDRFGWHIDSDTETVDDEQVSEANNSFKQTIDNLKHNIESLKPEQTLFYPLSSHSLLTGVDSISGKITSALLETRWFVWTDEDKLGFRLLSLQDQSETTMLWQLQTDAGQVILSLAPDLFNNQTLNKADNAVLFSNIVTLHLGENGTVIFDDYHFGLSDLYDPDQFFADERLHQTLAFIFLLWLFYVFGYSQRLAPVRAKKTRPSAVDYVNAMAGFFANRLDKKTIARELTRWLFKDVRRHWHFSSDQEVWRWLQQHPKLDRSLLALLQKAEQNQPVSLSTLSQNIITIRKQIFL